MSDKIQVGRPLPDLPVVNLEGQPTTVPAHLGPRGGFVSLVHGTWCSDCVIEFYRLRRYHRDFMSRGVAIVAIAHDAPESLALFRASAVPAIDYTLLADPKRRAHRAVGAGATMAIIVDGGATIRWFERSTDHREPAGFTRLREILEADAPAGR